MYIEKNNCKYEVVDRIPENYVIWNIGSNAPEGYLPICKLKDKYNIDVDTLKAIKTENSKILLKAAMYAQNSKKMISYIKRHENSKNSYYKRAVNICKKALPLLLQLEEK